MKVIKVKNYEELSRTAATIIAGVILSKPDCILGLATGSSPVGTYDQLTAMYKEGILDFSHVKSVNLDEYVGLDGSNDQSYRYFMNKNLFSRVNINIENTHVPDGTNLDAKACCEAYNTLLQNIGTVDLQLLGIGPNGHIGFNEPDDHFENGTHCVDLTEATIQANKRFFASAEDVPKQAYTMGIKTIMQAKKILVVVNGEAKADIVERAFFGPVTPEVPASILQMHNDVTLVGDEAALAKIVELHAEVLK